jgi:hypothetical protein
MTRFYNELDFGDNKKISCETLADKTEENDLQV